MAERRLSVARHVARQLLARLRRLWWRIVHYPYEVCWDCGRRACLDSYWFAPNELWNLVNGGPTGVKCQMCFTRAAAAKGVAVGWMADRVGDLEDAAQAPSRGPREASI